MRMEKNSLWENEDRSKAYYTAYLQDNSDEIEAGREHPAMIVCGGGGYLGISDREKEPVALYFLNKGYQVFVLEYTTAQTGCAVYPNPVYDLAKMILTVREQAAKWNVAEHKIAVIGFSAGAHLCACMATQWQESYLRERLNVRSELLRPDAVVLAYPITDALLQTKWLNEQDLSSSPSLNGESMESFFKRANEAVYGADYDEAMLKKASPIYSVTANVPPTFLWHTAEDEMVYAVNSLLFAKRLIEEGIDCELHLFEKGLHGMSLANRQSGGRAELMNETVTVWKELAAKFLERHFYTEYTEREQ